MEHAVDALKMAAAVIVFILALSLFFVTFAKAKTTSDSLLTMQDKQLYLEADSVENVLYRSDEGVTSDTTNYTSEGYRIVGLDAVISTIYRYDNEKFGVTIMDNLGNVIVRYDSATEALVNQWNYISTSDILNYEQELENNLEVAVNGTTTTPIYINKLKDLYEIMVPGPVEVGAPWYGNSQEIMKRIKADIKGTNYQYNGKEYAGKKLEDYTSRTFIEITKEIDNSEYIVDGSEITDLVDEYKMPTVEVIYILQ